MVAVPAARVVKRPWRSRRLVVNRSWRFTVLGGQLAVRAVGHAAHRAGGDEQYLAAAVTEPAVVAVAGDEPEARRDLRRVKELPGQRHHAVDQILLDEPLADLPLARLVRGHRAVREHKAGDAARGEVVHEVLHPREVGVARRRHAVLPALVVGEALAAPVGDVEGRIGEDVVGTGRGRGRAHTHGSPGEALEGQCWSPGRPTGTWEPRCARAGVDHHDQQFQQKGS